MAEQGERQQVKRKLADLNREELENAVRRLQSRLKVIKDDREVLRKRLDDLSQERKEEEASAVQQLERDNQDLSSKLKDIVQRYSTLQQRMRENEEASAKKDELLVQANARVRQAQMKAAAGGDQAMQDLRAELEQQKQLNMQLGQELQRQANPPAGSADGGEDVQRMKENLVTQTGKLKKALELCKKYKAQVASQQDQIAELTSGGAAGSGEPERLASLESSNAALEAANAQLRSRVQQMQEQLQQVQSTQSQSSAAAEEAGEERDSARKKISELKSHAEAAAAKLRGEIENANHELARVSKERDEAKEAARTLKDSFSLESTTMEQQLSEAQQSQAEAAAELFLIQKELAQLRQQQEGSSESSAKALADARAAHEKERNALRVQITDMQKRAAAAQQQAAEQAKVLEGERDAARGALREQEGSSESSAKALADARAAHEKERNALRVQITDMQKRAAAAQQQAAEQAKALADAKAEAAMVAESGKARQASREKAEAELAALKKALAGKDEELRRLQEEASRGKDECLAAEGRVGAMEEELCALREDAEAKGVEAQAKCDALASELEAALAANAGLEAGIAARDAQLAESCAREKTSAEHIARLEKDGADTSATVEKARREVEQYRRATGEATEEIRALNEERQKLREDLKAACEGSSDAEAVAKEMDEMRRALSLAKAAKDQLSASAEGLKGSLAEAEARAVKAEERASALAEEMSGAAASQEAALSEARDAASAERARLEEVLALLKADRARLVKAQGSGGDRSEPADGEEHAFAAESAVPATAAFIDLCRRHSTGLRQKLQQVHGALKKTTAQLKALAEARDADRARLEGELSAREEEHRRRLSALEAAIAETPQRVDAAAGGEILLCVRDPDGAAPWVLLRAAGGRETGWLRADEAAEAASGGAQLAGLGASGFLDAEALSSPRTLQDEHASEMESRQEAFNVYRARAHEAVKRGEVQQKELAERVAALESEGAAERTRKEAAEEGRAALEKEVQKLEEEALEAKRRAQEATRSLEGEAGAVKSSLAEAQRERDNLRKVMQEKDEMTEAELETLRERHAAEVAALRREMEEQKRDAKTRGDMARRLLAEKERTLEAMRREVGEPELTPARAPAATRTAKAGGGGAGAEQQLLAIARLQATRDEEIARLRHQVGRAAAAAKGRDVEVQRLNGLLRQEEVKAATAAEEMRRRMELASHDEQDENAAVRLSYLKQALIRYMCCGLAAASERESLVPVIATIMRFDADETARVQKAVAELRPGILSRMGM